MPTPEVLAEIRRASRPHGVATLQGLNLSERQVQHCCEVGVLDRRHPGVFVDTAVPRSPLQDLAVAVAAGGHLAAAWGRSAAALWNLTDTFPATPEIVVPRRRVARVAGAVVHRSTDLCAAHLSMRRGIRSTNPLVTVLDLGVVLDPVSVADLIIAGRNMKLFEPVAVAATLDRLARPGRTGVRVVRDALGLVMIDGRPADTVLELRFAIMANQAGLPPYRYQFKVTVKRKTFFIDFAYPEVRLAIEVDGYEKRATSEALDYDGRRANLLVLDGWTILRFTWARLRDDPAGVAAEIIAALARLGYRFAA